MTPPAGEASPLARFSWAMFDWANQPFFTVVTTFIFAPYFTSVVVGDPVRGQALWGYAQSAAGLAIALSSPVLGAIADAAGPRKGWTFVFQVLCALGCFWLWWAVPAAGPATLFWSLVAIGLATIGAEFSIVFNNAMLPSLVPEDRMGRLSGFAWALGYAGGLVALIFVLVAFSLPEHPWFGLDKASHQHDRITGPLSAIWLAVFVLPLFLFTPDAKPTGLTRTQAVREGLRNVAATLVTVRRYRNIMQFLVARMIAYDGLNAIFAFGGIYAAGIFGWTTTSLGIFGIVLTIFAALGAWVGGWADDRFGSKPTMQWSVLGVTLATLGILSMSGDSVLFGIAVEGPRPGIAGGLFATTAERIFLLLGILLGIFGGPMQAASRTMLARLAPPSMVGEFYGLFALSGKATAFTAPFAIAVCTSLFASQRGGMVAIVLFLVVGYLLMLPVREEQAAEAA